MAFSVLMSLYWKERPDDLSQSLESVFDSTLMPDEVILVEDGPLTAELDGTVDDFCRRYPQLKIIRLDRNVGLGRALNEGLKYCSYDLVARMDADDIAKPTRFEKQVAFMDAHPEIAVCSAWIDEFDDDKNKIVSVRKLPEHHEEIYRYGQSRNPINHPVVMFRREAVMSCGSYQHIFLLEDYYLWGRMLTEGYKFYNIQESLLNFRISTDVYHRRGGLKYALAEMKLFRRFYSIGYIGLNRMIMNMGIRFIVRTVPNGIRGEIYKKFLRR